MRFFAECSFFLVLSSVALAQGSPPIDPTQIAEAQPQAATSTPEGSPPSAPQPSPIHQMTALIRRQINKAIDGKPYPSLENWSPLTTREKFHKFLGHTYAGRTFANAAVDSLKGSSIRKRNSEYETGLMGFGQQYGVYLGASETEIFFEQFLVPSVLKQDPRYFRNPRLPFLKRAAYSMSRVFITRADDGRETFNASRILGGAASQALGDLYVPGQRQGMSPVLHCVAFGLVRDVGFNLMHEFWPDLRRKFLHR